MEQKTVIELENVQVFQEDKKFRSIVQVNGEFYRYFIQKFKFFTSEIKLLTWLCCL